MRILELEKLAIQEDTVGLVLDEVVEDIKIVDDYAKKLKDHLCDNPEANKMAQSKLVGAYSNISTAWSVVESAKTNAELKYYYDKKSNCEGKFNASATKEEARSTTCERRRIRNYLESYSNAAEKDIIVLQSMLKDTLKQHNTHTE